MRKTYLVVLIFILASLIGCNGANNEADTRNEWLTGENVNYHSGKKRTNADWKLARSIITYQHSENQTSNFPTHQQDATIIRVGNAGPRGLGDTLEANPTSDFFIAEVIDLTNEERRRHRLPPLTAESNLQKAAQLKSEDMSVHNNLSHSSPTYGSPFQMLQDLGIEYSVAAENIAQGQQTPREVVRAWMNSTGHRQNILNNDITHIGVGFEPSGSYWTQIFIKK
jgi:uncharacterized YkwD family protein